MFLIIFQNILVYLSPLVFRIIVLYICYRYQRSSAYPPHLAWFTVVFSYEPWPYLSRFIYLTPFVVVICSIQFLLYRITYFRKISTYVSSRFVVVMQSAYQKTETIALSEIWCFTGDGDSSSSVIKQFLLHSCPYTLASCIIMASSSSTVHALDNAVFLDSSSVCSTCILAAAVGMHNGSANIRIPQARIFQCFAA